MRADAVQQRWARFSLALANVPEETRAKVTEELSHEFPRFVPLSADVARDYLERSGVELPGALAGNQMLMDQVINRGGDTWERPTCECLPITVGGSQCEQITLTFHTSRSVPDMAPYADPRVWPTCSSFWAAMAPMSMAPSKTTPPNNDWLATFQEEVEVVPGYPMTTPLAFSFRTPAADHVRSEYWLLNETQYIEVDQGSIDICTDTDPSCPAGMSTKVVAIKTICWKSSALRDIPNLLCATVWGELGLNMAVRCSL